MSKLLELYNQTSKHSGYQEIPKVLSSILNPGKISYNSRFETQRFEYISSQVAFKDKSVVDIGGNTGYFAFSALDEGASRVDVYEGNKNHAKFVQLAAKEVGLSNRLKVFGEYYTFGENEKDKYDIAFILNVVHHIGDDFEYKSYSEMSVKEKMCDVINSMTNRCDQMVLQLGFNWKGNTNKPIFEGGLKKNMIKFVRGCTHKMWEVKSIGVPVKTDNSIVYRELGEDNIERDNALGEFLNRPLFILQRKGS